VSGDSGGFLYTIPASEVVSFLPLEPVVREDKGRVALPASGVLLVRNLDSLHCVYLQLNSRQVEHVLDLLLGVKIMLEGIDLQNCLFGSHSLLEAPLHHTLQAEQFGIAKVVLDALHSQQTFQFLA
jgi:hypothetical protein